MNMDTQNHSCCEVPANEETSVCKQCLNKGKSVKEITVKSLTKEPKLETITSLQGFYFCETPPCKVVYFNNEQQIYLYKEDIKVRVGIKETQDPIPVCYCHGWTQEKIYEQIKQHGYSTAVEEITAKVKAKECACEINNPSGRCCLGEVKKVIKQGMEIYGKAQTIKQKEATLKNITLIGATLRYRRLCMLYRTSYLRYFKYWWCWIIFKI
jgi:bacterioferritin-associated ferredoxin